MTDRPPSFRDIAATTFQAVGPSRIAVLTIQAMRADDLTCSGRRATLKEAVARIERAFAMLDTGFAAALAAVGFEEPRSLERARAEARSVVASIRAALPADALPTRDALPDPEAYRTLCLDRVDPTVTAFLTLMIQAMNDAQDRVDTAHRGEAIRAVQSARSVGRSIQMVALNAAIEASNSGADGRGFMVIAEEIRTLADRTQTILCEVAEGLRS
ncbi:methyl-accepting chemotaxis protein [Jannaschia marina]|uniref:methyl-accepting chemotaxis protein n=1 Tax=Jannaschia marina TaxID=2741674 RepID=UPI0015CAA5EC|nr:methyl-accepting chemotaxis protein [Jannaschia marina]